MAAKDKDEISKTIAELEALQKSKDETAFDGIDALEKALAEFDDLDPLNKAEEDDDKGAKDDDGKDKEPDDDKDDKDPEDKGGEPVEKSITGQELAEELVKASEAYAELEHAVEEMHKSHSQEIGALSSQVGDLCNAVAGLTHLMQATGKGIITLNKSVREGMEVIGGMPAKQNGAIIGEHHTEVFQKSKSEVVGLIKTALNDGILQRHEAHWLSKASVHGEACLSDEVKKKIGLV